MNTLGIKSILEQADRSNETKVVYSWIIDARKGKSKQLLGWKWVSGAGCRGMFVTNNRQLALATAKQFGLQVESNGTHVVSNAPMDLSNEEISRQ